MTNLTVPSGRAGAQMLPSWLPVQPTFLTSPYLPLNMSEMIQLSYNKQKSNEGSKIEKKERKKESETERKGWKRQTEITGGTSPPSAAVCLRLSLHLPDPTLFSISTLPPTCRLLKEHSAISFTLNTSEEGLEMSRTLVGPGAVTVNSPGLLLHACPKPTRLHCK